MYPVAANFHTLAIQDAPKTRVRIYFIGDGVDCTDDNDVQTNGTLLVGAAGDTDSNGRIASDGIVFNQFFNPDKNITVGECVSSQIEIALLNFDGALDGFAFGRCKVYLDVYDTANSVWLPCPMGVYLIEQPIRTSHDVVRVSGYDQIELLDRIADDWWASIDWSVGLTWEDIVNSMASYIGVQAIPNYGGIGANTSIEYTAAPFECVEKTFRDVLKYIGDFSAGNAHFNRDGKLITKSFVLVQYPDSGDVYIDTDTVGNQCLSIDIAAYTVEQIDTLTLKNADGNVDITAGGGDQKYAMFDNPMFTNGVSNDPFVPDTTQQRVDYTLGSLQQVNDYDPIQGSFIWDWSLDAGDIIYITRGGVDYVMPIFQQRMVWRGGFVIATALSDGDKVRPVSSEKSREAYQANVALSDKVGINEVVSALNNTTEQVDILRNVTVNSLNGVKLSITDIPGGSSATFNMPNADKSLFVVIGASANNKCLLITNTSTTGAVTVAQTPTASNITYTTATRQLTITSASVASRILRIQF